MAWIKTPNVAQYKGADWKNFVHRERNCTLAEAKRIAFRNPNIRFFFLCRQHMVLEGPVFNEYGAFNPGDAVFFTGEPWYGFAPQCDGYHKNGMFIAYINPKSPQQFRNVGNYTLADGTPAIDVVCLFAAAYAADTKPYLRAENNVPPTTKPFNDNIQAVLDDGSVKYLQDKGLMVTLSILNGHHGVGWSEFTSEDSAKDFADYLKTDVVDKYGLDDIDVDDEFSNGTANDTSLIMVTTRLREIMPNTTITKALFDDLSYFGASWNGHTLGANLTYGWEMSYGGDPQSRLQRYTPYMKRNRLALGFWTGQPSSNPANDIEWLKANGYGGVMVFGFETPESVALMGQLVAAWYGPGNWNPPPA